MQQRTANAANEIIDVSETVGDQWVTPAHDRNGNLMTILQPADPTSEYACTYDAWNRLVKVETDAPATIAEYAYDAANRRIRKYVPGSPDSYQHLYYNVGWQLLESREASTAPVPATAQYQYVWSLRNLDAFVLRDDIAAAPDVRLYYSGDANLYEQWNTGSATGGQKVEILVSETGMKVSEWGWRLKDGGGVAWTKVEYLRKYWRWGQIHHEMYPI